MKRALRTHLIIALGSRFADWLEKISAASYIGFMLAFLYPTPIIDSNKTAFYFIIFGSFLGCLFLTCCKAIVEFCINRIDSNTKKIEEFDEITKAIQILERELQEKREQRAKLMKDKNQYS